MERVAKALKRMIETGDQGPTLHPVEEPGEQLAMFDVDQTTEPPAGGPAWTEGDLRLLGESIRDHLRLVTRRAIAAFVRGGIDRGDAELYVSEDLEQVARETWSAPKGTNRPPWRGGAGGVKREDTGGA